MRKELIRSLLYGQKNCILTHSGTYLNLLDPKPEQILIDDIAHALSHTPRFAGHTEAFYSVAEHSIEVAKYVPQGFKLEALLHDATEAYLSDLPSPLKKHCRDYRKIERRLYKVIAKKFGIPKKMTPEVHAADVLALEEEFAHLHLNKKTDWYFPPEYSKKYFLDRFYAYTNGTKI